MNKCHFSENKWLLFKNKRTLFSNNQGLLTSNLTLTRHLTDLTAFCSLLSDRQQGSVKPTAGRRVTVSREGVSGNTFGVIENTLGLFKISFGVFFNKARFSANKVALLTNMLTFSNFG